MRRVLPLMVVALVFCLAAPVFSQSILIWDKDHNKMFADPEGAGSVDATYGVKKALTDIGYEFDAVNALPANLTRFDIIFVIMGVYC